LAESLEASNQKENEINIEQTNTNEISPGGCDDVDGDGALWSGRSGDAGVL